MKTINIKAPQFDELVNTAKQNNVISEIGKYEELKSFFNSLCKLKSVGDDEARSFWLELDRGTIDDFGSYSEYLNEGIVTNEQEFEQYWKETYPQKTKWYRFAAATFNNEYYFYIDGSLVIHAKFEDNENPLYEKQVEFIDILKGIVTEKLKQIISSPEMYNMHVANNLPHKKRYGRILRSDYWSIFKRDRQRFAKNLTTEDIEIIAKISSEPKELLNKYTYNTMTAARFFEVCELGYDANKYFKKIKKQLKPVEKYAMMADGRDCGLKEIDANAQDAFAKWYKGDSHCGGHPWEICRGGNSTHISLYVRYENGCWSFDLDGSSHSRVIETVKFAVAFFKNNIPFELRRADAIYCMITGTDYIGIVPDSVFPRYCHSLFPNEDKIIDFMQLGFEKTNQIVKKAYWYPEIEVELL